MLCKFVLVNKDFFCCFSLFSWSIVIKNNWFHHLFNYNSSSSSSSNNKRFWSIFIQWNKKWIQFQLLTKIDQSFFCTIIQCLYVTFNSIENGCFYCLVIDSRLNHHYLPCLDYMTKIHVTIMLENYDVPKFHSKVSQCFLFHVY